ncbi:RNA-guided endonuclease TnpB family protein [Okeania sp. KiyG1]|uniref:RNA-guided endonuclease InsQ/TnpB family protein n=1 Tax=Okeania sp. KiyG1 TaxID=2720165 RepID=UPI002104FB3A|nr:RNA-guided endonuclease TnpB family protein [Okeania sp. KiyG1]
MIRCHRLLGALCGESRTQGFEVEVRAVIRHIDYNNHGTVVIEDLNVSGMLANHKLAKSIADQGFYEFRRQLEYKCQWYGSELVVVDRFFPSSKTCSNCGHVQDMSLSLRTYDCPECGISIDRDLNASINLRNAVGLTVNACG